ncbi:hypothetical protein [Pseudomonas sp. NBRC 111118]|uniref:hypothetical protein n=1 Tax=Pseudomonas sp. NBRC 111118 TaxID=1661033 RepID=UPI0006D3C239|nr:hypothetical protein [Pseudomonas sp. NBRC 111118]
MNVLKIKHLEKQPKSLLWNLLVSEILLVYVFFNLALQGLVFSIDYKFLGLLGACLCSISAMGFMFHALLVAIFIMKRFKKEPA